MLLGQNIISKINSSVEELTRSMRGERTLSFTETVQQSVSTNWTKQRRQMRGSHLGNEPAPGRCLFAFPCLNFFNSAFQIQK